MGAGGSKGINLSAIRERGRSLELGALCFLVLSWCADQQKKDAIGLLSQPRRDRSTVGSWVRVRLECSAVELLANELRSGEARQDHAARENSVRNSSANQG